MPCSTVRSWKRRGLLKVPGATAAATPLPVEPPREPARLPPTWQRSLHHEWAHLVAADGLAVCSAAVPLGSRWFPAEETRRCKRCMGWERKNSPQASSEVM